MLTVVPEIFPTEGPGEYVIVLLSRRYILYADFSFPEYITYEVKTRVDVLVPN